MNSWHKGDGFTIQQHIGLYSEALQSWGVKVRHKFNEKIKLCRSEINRLKRAKDDFSLQRLLVVKHDLGVLLYQQESY